MKIILRPNEQRTGFRTSGDYTKAMLSDWLKTYNAFELSPVVVENKKKRRYLEGAVIPAYCQWQYGIDPREPGMDEARRTLFKRDFHYQVIENRNGDPERIPLSSQGKASVILDKWTTWADQNGCPVPNPELYKLWRDQWQLDPRFPTYFDFLSFLKLEIDAMPSAEALAVLEEGKPRSRAPKYSEQDQSTSADQF